MEVRSYRDIVLYQNDEVLTYTRRYQAIRLAEQMLNDDAFFTHIRTAEVDGHRESILSIDVVVR